MTHGFVRRQNIERFRKMLAAATDEPTRALVQKLLDEEVAKERSTRTADNGSRDPAGG